MKHINNNTTEIKRPLIILMDGAPCHFDVEALEYARDNNLILVTLPSNTTH